MSYACVQLSSSNTAAVQFDTVDMVRAVVMVIKVREETWLVAGELHPVHVSPSAHA